MTTPESELQYQKQLTQLVQQIHESDDFFEAMPEFESNMRELLGCERVTVYSKSRNDSEIISKYKSGTDIMEIRVPLSTTSVSGFVAMSQKALLIKDVYNDNELQKLHGDLRFNKSFDKQSGFRTKSMIVVPIKSGDVLLGVLQVLNKAGGGSFEKQDVKPAFQIAKVLGQKFRFELKGTKGPFDWLVHTKKIKQEQLDKIVERAAKEGADVHQMVMSEGGISKQELGSSLEHYYQVPFVGYDPHKNIPTGLLQGINIAYLQQQLWVPIAGSRDGQVTIIIDDPSDAARIMEIHRSLPAKQYSFQVALKEDILRYLGQGSGSGESSADIHELVGKLQEEAIEIADTAQSEEEVGDGDATVIQLVNKLITEAYQERASDIHIEPGKGTANATVRIRVDGALRPLFSVPHTHVKAVVSRIKIISGLDISERRKPQDGKAAVRFRGEPLELRVATVPTVHGESVVMRILASSEPLPLDKLNFSKRIHEEVIRITSQPHGIFLVVGPTGSGKTTTLHAILGHINQPDRKIWTAEDPVEITQPGLAQVQMKPAINLTFATALRAFLRADPDVIMIGEMRDYETAHIGVEASLTGHFVFSTLHTNSAPETVTRLLDLGLDPVSFSDALQGVLAQRLVRTLCKKCQEEYVIPEKEYEVLRRYYGEQYFDELAVECDKTIIKRAVGCAECGNTGYKGRTGIHELLVATDPIKAMIYKKAGLAELRDHAAKEGSRSLMQDGIRKLFLGQTDLTQIRKVAAS